MKLAKDALDVGLLTDDEAMIAFFQKEVGLGEPELLRVGPGVNQHRFDFLGSVIKVNVVTDLPTEARSGYAALLLKSAHLGAPRTLSGPDDVVVDIAPGDDETVTRLGVRLRVPQLERARRYFRDSLGWEVSSNRVQMGSTVLLLEEDPDAPSSIRMPVRGWTYLTVQVFECDRVTEDVVSRGATLASAPRTLGDVARFSMVADPWGNQLEISQRRSLTGKSLEPERPG